MLNRKHFLSSSSSLSLIPFLGQCEEKTDFKIGICDWNAKGKGLPEVFKTVKELGLDGVQLSYEPRHPKYDLREKEQQIHFLNEANNHQIEIASMAMGIFNKHPFSSFEDAPKWADECLDIMLAMKQKLVLFAFFGKGDIKDKPESQKNVIARLKALMPKAEKHGLTIGLETWLNQEDHMHILDSVGSNNVKVYYDTANMEKQGYNIYEEIRWLGKKEAICQVHMKEVGNRLGKGKVNFPKVKEALHDIDYKDWLIIESAVKGDWRESHIANGQYLRKLFN